MEGVDNHGRFYLLDRPSPEAVQNRLWMLLLSAEQKRDELCDQLKYKIEDSLCGMMRELWVKDMLLVDKDIEIKKKDRELEDSVRQAREDVRREVEVGCCVWC